MAQCGRSIAFGAWDRSVSCQFRFHSVRSQIQWSYSVFERTTNTEINMDITIAIDGPRPRTCHIVIFTLVSPLSPFWPASETASYWGFPTLIRICFHIDSDLFHRPPDFHQHGISCVSSIEHPAIMKGSAQDDLKRMSLPFASGFMPFETVEDRASLSICTPAHMQARFACRSTLHHRRVYGSGRHR